MAEYGFIDHWDKFKANIDSIHYSKCDDDRWDVAYELTAFLTKIKAVNFLEYMDRYWLSGSFNRWSIYHSPPGFAKTNNPLEITNLDLKNTYILRQKGKVPQLIDI